MPKLSFDKEKYTQIAKSEGVAAALTQLHKDTTRWEYQAFEGKDGYSPKLWEDIDEVREFSRELWEMDLRAPDKKSG